MVDGSLNWPRGSFSLGPAVIVSPGDGAVEVTPGGYVVVREGVIAGVTMQPPSDLPRAVVEGCLVTPGLIDCHTHSVFGGWRFDEWELRQSGATYAEIMARGGGIVNTVQQTRAAGEEELVDLCVGRLEEFKRMGVVTVEIKSGYGLDREHELKMLRAARTAGERAGIEVVLTFMGGHALPPEFAGRRDEYVELVCEEQIPAVAGLARFCDVFCERGAFSLDESRRILEAGVRHGLRPKIHADELAAGGGAGLAADIGAVSAEHLLHAADADLVRMVAAGVTGVLLPGTSFHLGERYGPARRLLELGGTVAVATDFNPGSSPLMDLRLAMHLACTRLAMTPAQTLAAVTVGAARALDLPGVGRIAPGFRADLAVWNVSDYRHLMAVIGDRPLVQSYRAGQPLLPGEGHDGAVQ